MTIPQIDKKKVFDTAKGVFKNPTPWQIAVLVLAIICVALFFRARKLDKPDERYYDILRKQERAKYLEKEAGYERDIDSLNIVIDWMAARADSLQNLIPNETKKVKRVRKDVANYRTKPEYKRYELWAERAKKPLDSI